MSDTLKLMRSQTEVLSELPGTIMELQRTVRGLGETLAAAKEAVASSKDAAESAQRTAARVEAALDEIEEPIRALRPGLERLAVALDNPVVDRLPAMLEAIEATVLPISEGVRRMRDRWTAAKERGRDVSSHAREFVTRNGGPRHD